jgi:hypothetical protein
MPSSNAAPETGYIEKRRTEQPTNIDSIELTCRNAHRIARYLHDAMMLK